MNRKTKNALKIAAVGAAMITAASAWAAYRLYRQPSVRFLLSQAGWREPDKCFRKEIIMSVDGEDTSVMVYRHRSRSSDRYYYFQHGHTLETNRHPALDRLARSLCDATGMNVLIPAFDPLRGGGSLEYYIRRVAAVYQALARKFPGRYRAYGACIGANVLLAALRRVPAEIYPQKMLLTSAFYNGKALVNGYRKLIGSDNELDLIFKLAVTLDARVFSEREKAEIKKALTVSASAGADLGRMRQVTGEKLFNELIVLDAQRGALERIEPGMTFGPVARRPPCTYFILHSKHDEIVPYREGKKLAAYMQETGMNASFLGTELVGHSENKLTVTGFAREVEQLVHFLDRLFEGDA